MAEELPVSQYAQGSYIAQATGGGTAIVNVYQNTPVHPVDPLVVSEAKRLLETLPLDHIPNVSPIPPHSRIVFAPNSFFVGREADLRWLAAAFKKGVTNTSGPITTVAVSGLGGIGKTQLVSEFVHRYGRYFSGGIFWISFADPTNILQEIASCRTALQSELSFDTSQLSREEQVKFEEQVKRILGVWQSALPRLLVFDNCEDEGLLAHWRPPTGGCCILLTSRRAGWSPNLGVAELALAPFHRNESIAFLSKYRPDLTHEDAESIAYAGGYLPLALHLSGSFLFTYRATRLGVPTIYLEELKKAPLQYLQGRGALYSATLHEQNIERTFALSYSQLNNDVICDHEALRIIARAAYLAPGEIIPRALLNATLQQGAIDQDRELLIEDALRRLSGLGILNSVSGRRDHFLNPVEKMTNAQGTYLRMLENSTDAPLNSTSLVRQDDDEYFLLHRLFAMFVRAKTSGIVGQEAQRDGENAVITIIDQEESNPGADIRAFHYMFPHIDEIIERLRQRGDRTASTLAKKAERIRIRYAMFMQNSEFQLVSNILKSPHEALKKSIRNMK